MSDFKGNLDHQEQEGARNGLTWNPAHGFASVTHTLHLCEFTKHRLCWLVTCPCHTHAMMTTNTHTHTHMHAHTCTQYVTSITTCLHVVYTHFCTYVCRHSHTHTQIIIRRHHTQPHRPLPIQRHTHTHTHTLVLGLGDE